MYRIGQFAELCHTSGKTLRFYDSLGILKPDYTDSSTGYRFYSKSNVMAFDKIRLLKKIGFTLKEIKDNFFCATDAEVLSLLSSKEKALLEAYKNCRGVRRQYEETLKMLNNAPRTEIKKRTGNGNISFSDGKSAFSIKFEGSGDDGFISMLDELLNGDIIENIHFDDLCRIAKTADTVSFEALRLNGANISPAKAAPSVKTVKGAVILVKLPADKTLSEAGSAVGSVLSTLPKTAEIVWGAAVDKTLCGRFAVFVARFS